MPHAMVWQDGIVYQATLNGVAAMPQEGGEYILRSDHIIPVSGDWTPQRLVLIRFNRKTDIQRCFGSEEYQRIKHLREQSTKSRSVIIDQDDISQRRMEI